MDFMKMIRSGLSSGFMAIIGILATVLIGALTLALGFKPDGAMAEVVFHWVVTPTLIGIVRMLNNYLKHKNDKKSS